MTFHFNSRAVLASDTRKRWQTGGGGGGGKVGGHGRLPTPLAPPLPFIHPSPSLPGIQEKHQNMPGRDGKEMWVCVCVGGGEEDS